MHLALFVMLREFQQIAVGITRPHMIEYVAAATIIYLIGLCPIL